MAMTVRCDIVSAEEKVFSGLVELMVCTGEMGELGIRPGHAPLLTRLSPGPLHLVKQHGKKEFIYVEGGYLEVQPNLITVLADTALRANDLDEAAASQAKEIAEKQVAQSLADKEYAEVAIQLSKALGKLRTIRQAKNNG
ncbi:F0F1 ATP synthase subunit epsilon [Reinekea thalattae]|uniref:ATP synthase epsilon chain n=1 Tax=Reinekea thalattae TaxID=2593301 RepID=A0A5C8ZAY5_9GAMM|nr:F0F1 ATP synthase subunit epsilon [Reinekea thalattae]TXR54604.1 F0F1 ATP synthase subunit epsilon [Reinekea thalattae]